MDKRKVKQMTKGAHNRVARRAVKESSRRSAKQRFDALYKATAPFRETKKRTISRICSVGVRHKWLKYPALVWAVVFIFFVNVAFYLCLWVLLHKRAAIGLAISLVAFIGIIFVASDYDASKGLYRHTNEAFVVIHGSHPDSGDAVEPESGDDVSDINDGVNVVPIWHDAVSVDFASLKSLNEDIVGWLYFENEDISYPILQGADDSEYIRTTYTGENSRVGSIFLESLNSPDFTDRHTIIYGHNMRNLSMFGKLRYYYRDTKYYTGHEYFQIITPDTAYRYQIISYKRVAGDSPIYAVYESDTIGYNDFIDDVVLKDSMIETGIRPGYRDDIVTLSTCSAGNDRFVVSAVKIDEYEY